MCVHESILCAVSWKFECLHNFSKNMTSTSSGLLPRTSVNTGTLNMTNITPRGNATQRHSTRADAATYPADSVFDAHEDQQQQQQQQQAQQEQQEQQQQHKKWPGQFTHCRFSCFATTYAQQTSTTTNCKLDAHSQQPNSRTEKQKQIHKNKAVGSRWTMALPYETYSNCCLFELQLLPSILAQHSLLAAGFVVTLRGHFVHLVAATM